MSKRKNRSNNSQENTNTKRYKDINETSGSSNSSTTMQDSVYENFLEENILNSTETENQMDQKASTDLALLDDGIAQLEATPNPSIKDLSGALLLLMKFHKSFIMDTQSLRKQLKSVVSKTVENSVEIINMKKTINSMSEINKKLTEKVIRAEQSQIANEVFVSGLPHMTDSSKIVDALCALLKMPVNSVENHYSYKFKNKTSNVEESHLVIKFKSKPLHIMFNKKKREAGKILVKQLITLPTAAPDIAIKISNRLILENRLVIKELRDLQTKAVVQEGGIRYRNCLFQAKLGDDPNFIPIPSCEHLSILVESMFK